jgi:hypothetical protein
MDFKASVECSEKFDPIGDVGIPVLPATSYIALTAL